MHRIALISDTHLSPRQGYFYANAARTIEAINAALPDLVVNCGDLTVNGADDEDDLRFAAFAHRALTAPFVAAPGNHDVGEEPGAVHAEQPVTSERIARYRAVFGPDCWARDLGAWRVLGLNGLLIGSGLDEEEAQEAWFVAEAMAARGRPVLVVTHKPLWLERIDEAPQREWTMAPERVPMWLKRFAEANVRVVASGHLHQHRTRLADGLLHVWAPSSAFPATSALGGDPALGFTLLTLTDDGAAAARFIAPAGLEPHDYYAIKGDAAHLKDAPAHPPGDNRR